MICWYVIHVSMYCIIMKLLWLGRCLDFICWLSEHNKWSYKELLATIVQVCEEGKTKKERRIGVFINAQFSYVMWFTNNKQTSKSCLVVKTYWIKTKQSKHVMMTISLLYDLQPGLLWQFDGFVFNYRIGACEWII